MWLLLAASLLFLTIAHRHVRREEARDLSEALSRLSGEAHLAVEPVESPIRADRLYLRWQSVEGADHYLLRLNSVDEGMILDRLRVRENAWLPDDDLVSILKTGGYTWEVEAVGPEGRVTARSSQAAFEIGR